MALSYLLRFAVMGSAVLGLWFGWKNWVRLDSPLRMVVILLGVKIAALPVSWWLSQLTNRNHLWFNLIAPVEVFGFMAILSGWVPIRWKKVPWVVAGGYGIFWLGRHLMADPWTWIQGPTLALRHLLVLGGAILLLYSKSLDEDRYLAANPGFWVGSGALLESSSALFLMLFLPWLLEASLPLAIAANRFSVGLTVCSNLMAIKAFRCKTSN